MIINKIMESDDETGNPLDGFWMEGDSLAPPCQAEMDVIDIILGLANLNTESVLYDLGCGDGRICIEASKRFGAKSRGVEIEEDLFSKFRANILKYGLTEMTVAIHGDLVEVNLDDATVIVLYLLPPAIELIRPKLEECIRKGCVVICNSWGPKSWKAIQRVTCGPYNNVDIMLYDSSSLPTPV